VTASAFLWAWEQERSESGLADGASARERDVQNANENDGKPWSFFYG
jgi:hypothetical protein